MAFSITVDQVAYKLGGAKYSGNGGWYCRCPSHEDKKASLWIQQRDGGGLHVKCHAGCAKENVEHALQNLKLWPMTGARKPDHKAHNRRMKKLSEIESVVVPVPADAPPIDFSKFRKGEPTRLFDYRNEQGELVGYVARWDTLTDGKEILPYSLCRLKVGALEWAFKAPPPPYHLYNLSLLASRREAPVIIVEGEKAAEAAMKLFPEYVCLSWRGGAGSVDNSDFRPLRGRHVTLWPDADDAGKKAMTKVAAKLSKIGVAEVCTVMLPEGLPKGWDVADHAPDGLDIKSLLETAAMSSATSSIEPLVPASVDADTPKSHLTEFVVSAAELVKMDLPMREWIVGNWISTRSLAMVYAERGLGKTWWSLSLSLSVAKGEAFLEYQVTEPRFVLYVDGEMALSDLQSRIKSMDENPPEKLMLLPSERLFREAKPINLHEEADQTAISSALEDLEQQGRRPDLIVFDNLSSLSGGVDENDNSALDSLLRWMVKLKHLGYAILFVHHTGKSGAQRGASRREDLLDTSIALKAPDDDATPHDGASFTMQFTKTRGGRPKPFQLEMRLIQSRDRLEWAWNEPKNDDPVLRALKMIWESKPKNQKELAQFMSVSQASITNYCKKLRRDDLIEKEDLSLTKEGNKALLEQYPELEERMLRQGDLFPPDVL